MSYSGNLIEYFVSTLIILLLSAPIIFFEFPDSSKNYSGFQSESFELPFAIMDPDSVYTLPKKLKEISGLTYLDKDNIYAINDEKGNLYTFNFVEGEITGKIDIGKDDDYESLARNKNIVYVAESNGNIKVIDINKQTKVDEYDTPFSMRNNVEGMVYDSIGNQLLLACKGDPLDRKKNKGRKGIYSFNLFTEELNEEPYALISLKELRKALKPLNLTKGAMQDLNVNSRINIFAPSGLAIDPITGYLYILANRGKILLIMDQSKNPLGLYFLNRKLYGQPEGISFDPNGNLYISNESKAQKANIIFLSRKIL